MKNIVVVIFAIAFIGTAFCQDKIDYKTKDNKIMEFEISKEYIFIEGSSQNLKKSTEKSAYTTKDFGIFEVEKSRYDSKLNEQKSKFENVEPVLLFSDGSRFVSNDELIVKLKSKINLNEIFKDFDFTYTKNEFVENQYLVKLKRTTTQDVFNLVNSLQKDKRIDFIEPNFYIFSKMFASDPFLPSQWSLQNNGYLGGVQGADMKVLPAWAFSTGVGIKVAVLDSGVDLNHPDLVANLLGGYDAVNNITAGGISGPNDIHGTQCAGIIGAVQNNVGTVGVAYNAKIIPIKIATQDDSGHWIGWGDSATFRPNDVSTGVDWAWQHGADILSCSWSTIAPFTAITEAFNRATTSGRNGKGSIVLVSSGNFVPVQSNVVRYPATLSNVIAVGATSQCDQRKSFTSCDGETDWSSCFGTGLDVVAPGVNIYTTAVMGTGNSNDTNYDSSFNGTSAACPNAAGVMALILSASNNSLTLAEAREKLEKTTDKITNTNTPYYNYNSNLLNGTWSQEVGYGRVNALKAVVSASNIVIGGSLYICSGTSTYTLQNFVPGLTTVWTATPNLVLTSTTNNSVTVGLSSSAVNGSVGTLTATINGVKVVTKTISIGVPSLSTNPVNGSMWVRKGYYPVQLSVTPNTSATSYLWTLVEDTDFPSALGIKAKFSNGLTTFSSTSTQATIDFGTCLTHYHLTCDAVNACGSTPQFYRYVEVGVSGSSPCNQSATLKTSPNPITDKTVMVNVVGGDTPCYYDTPFIVSKNKKTQNTAKEVKIYNMTGLQVFSNTYMENETFAIKNLNLKKGNYILNVILPSGKNLKEIIIVE